MGFEELKINKIEEPESDQETEATEPEQELELEPEKEQGLVERNLKGSVNGYDTVEEGSEGITVIKGPDKSLSIGMSVETVGDSHDYVNGGFEPGEQVTILGFTDPDQETLCVEVENEGGNRGFVKLKEIK